MFEHFLAVIFHNVFNKGVLLFLEFVTFLLLQVPNGRRRKERFLSGNISKLFGRFAVTFFLRVAAGLIGDGLGDVAILCGFP